MDDQNKIQISLEGMIESWKDMCSKKDEEIALSATVMKAYDKLLKEKDEEI